MRTIARCVSLLLGLLLFSATRIPAFDVILDPREVNKMLAEIGTFFQESRSAKTERERLDSLYEMGERVLDLADLMTRDKDSHGAVDPSLAAVIQRRLSEYGVTLIADKLGYHYDLAAFKEYLRRAPNGERASDARYVLIGFDEPGENIPRLEQSIRDKEQFIRQYPKFPEMSLVKFLLAQQHVRLARLYAAQKRQPAADRQKKLAQDLYREIVRLYPKSEEAEAAADYLEQTGAKK